VQNNVIADRASILNKNIWVKNGIFSDGDVIAELCPCPQLRSVADL